MNYLFFETSVRKRVRKNPKFYLFDLGVQRALTRTLQLPLSSQEQGLGFETFIIQEITRLACYQKVPWEYFYLRTKDDAEIDLIIGHPGLPLLLIEIKATQRVTEDHVSSFAKLSKDFKGAERIVISQDPTPKTILGVDCLPWQQAMEQILSQ